MRQISAANMQEALALARTELGEDAVLLESKKAVGGGITVTFAIEEPDGPLFGDDPLYDEPFQEIIPRATTARAEIAHPALEIVAEAIAYHAIPPGISEKLFHRVHQVRFAPEALIDAAEIALAEALSGTINFKPISTGAAIPPERAIMLVGAHGAGKTLAISKFATELTLHKKRVAIISCDNERMGAADTLGSLASLLGCDFHVAEDRAALKPLIRQYQAQAWVLIDSAGINIYEFQQLKALGELASLHGVETILTCPAGMDPHEAQEMASVLGFLDIERMLVTRVDSTRRLASVFAAIASGGLALANLSSSASPSESCVPMSAAQLARLMLRHTREKLAQ